MAKLEISLTLKGESKETTFFLRNEGEQFFMVYGDSKEKKYELDRDVVTNIFSFKEKNLFEESDEIVEELMVGLSEDWIEAQSQGLEADSEEEKTSQKPGYGLKDIIVNPVNYSLDKLIQMVEDGDIEIAPRFQRNFVWDSKRKSRLIESILLGLPLPVIYLSEYDDGRMTVVDGLQRISTIRDFVNNKFALSDMEYFDNFNGKTFSELNLPPLQLRRFNQTQITCFKIDYRSPSQLKYDLFRRLNTGGKALNDQEIRNCLSRDPVQDALHEMIASEEFRTATCGSIKDTRMAAQESALKFICFYNIYKESDKLNGYDGNMSKTLDKCVEELNEMSKEVLSEYVALFKESMGFSYSLFGGYAFRKVSSDYASFRKSSINKSLLLVISVLLAVYQDEYKDRLSNVNLTDKLAKLLEMDSCLYNAISWNTSSGKNLSYVFSVLKENLFDKNILLNNE